jgi:ATP-dependent Lon protease
MDDLRDVAAEVKEQLEIIPVSRVSEILEQTGLLKPAAIAQVS